MKKEIKDKEAKVRIKKLKSVSESIKNRPYERLFGNQHARKYQDEDIERIADKLYAWFVAGNDVNDKPKLWMKDFCVQEGIPNQYLSEWEKKNEYFKFVFSLCKTRQESILFKLGLSTKSPMAIFALKNVAGWKNRTEVLGESPDENLSFEGW